MGFAMSMVDWLPWRWGRLPAHRPETPDEVVARELAGASEIFRRYGIDPDRRDSIGSAMLGMGDALADPREGIQPMLRGFFNAEALDAMFVHGGLLRAISARPAVDAISAGWRVDDGTEQDVTSRLDTRLGMRRKLTRSAVFSRAYGRSHLLIVTDDGAPIDQPLPPGPHKVLAVHVIMRREAVPVRWCVDMRDPNMGEVDIWQVTPTRPGCLIPMGFVHHSRMVTMRGFEAPLTSVPGMDLGRAVSAPDVYWPYLRDYIAGGDAVAVAALSMSVPVLWLGANQDAYSGSDRSEYLASIQLLKRRLSTFGLLPLSGSDKLDRISVQFTGIGEAMEALRARVSGIEGIPAIKLTGDAPQGLNTDGKSGSNTYSTLLRGLRDAAEEAATRIYNIEMGEDDRRFVWGDPEPASDYDLAKLDFMRVQRDAVLLANNVVARAEVRARYVGDDVLPNPVVVGFEPPEIEGPDDVELEDDTGPEMEEEADAEE